MIKHTPGPWIVFSHGDDISGEALPAGRPGECLGASPLENVRRAVDCVNALEEFADPSAVADLLEAAKAAEKYIVANAVDTALPEEWAPLWKAITKAEGGGE